MHPVTHFIDRGVPYNRRSHLTIPDRELLNTEVASSTTPIEGCHNNSLQPLSIHRMWTVQSLDQGHVQLVPIYMYSQI